MVVVRFAAFVILGMMSGGAIHAWYTVGERVIQRAESLSGPAMTDRVVIFVYSLWALIRESGGDWGTSRTLVLAGAYLIGAGLLITILVARWAVRLVAGGG